jgi:hypothetical protein
LESRLRPAGVVLAKVLRVDASDLLLPPAAG